MKDLPQEEEERMKQLLHNIVNPDKKKPVANTETNSKTSDENETILIEISDDEEKSTSQPADNTKKGNDSDKSKNEVPVPPLIKITRDINTTKKIVQSRKVLLAPIMTAPVKSVLKTKSPAGIIKIPLNNIIKANTHYKQKLLLSVNDRSNAEVLRRLKASSALQVSVQSNTTVAASATTARVIPNQICEIAKVVDVANIKCVSQTRKISPRGLHWFTSPSEIVSLSEQTEVQDNTAEKS